MKFAFELFLVFCFWFIIGAMLSSIGMPVWFAAAVPIACMLKPRARKINVNIRTISLAKLNKEIQMKNFFNNLIASIKSKLSGGITGKPLEHIANISAAALVGVGRGAIVFGAGIAVLLFASFGLFGFVALSIGKVKILLGICGLVAAFTFFMHLRESHVISVAVTDRSDVDSRS